LDLQMPPSIFIPFVTWEHSWITPAVESEPMSSLHHHQHRG
jgi:hypothetical protein